MHLRLPPSAVLWTFFGLALCMPALATEATPATPTLPPPASPTPATVRLVGDPGVLPLSIGPEGLVHRLWIPRRNRTAEAASADAGARAFLRRHTDALFGRPIAIDEAGEIRLQAERVRTSLTGTHRWWRQVVHGIPVDGGWVAVHQDRSGRIMEVQSTFRLRLEDIDPHPSVSAERARRLAEAAVDAQGPTRAPVQVELVIDGLRHRLVWKVVQALWAPYGDWCTWVDAHDGTVLETRNLLADGKPLPEAPLILDPPTPPGSTPAASPASATIALDPSSLVAGTGLVLPANPLNGHPERYDLRDGDPVDAFRERKTLYRLDGSGLLRGAYVDAFTDFYTQPEDSNLVFDYSADVAKSFFHAVNAYWHIDTVQDYLQTTLGITDANNRMTRIYAHYNEIDNSSYSPVTKNIRFGDGGVDDAEDGEIIVHEYGHAIHENIVPNYTNSGETGATSEAFGDYMAVTFGGNALVGEWDATSYNPGPPPYLRRTDLDKVYPQDMVYEIHSDGEIMSAVWWRLWNELGKETTDKLVVESFFHIGPDASFCDFADAMLLVDEELYGGSHTASIYAAYRDRGIHPHYDLMILHTPLADTGDLDGPYPVETWVTHGKPLAESDPVQLYWRWDGSDPWTVVSMSDEGELLWSAEIPGPGHTAVVEYAITAIDSLGVRVWSPQAGLDHPHSFSVAPDDTPPLLVHTPLGDVHLVNWPPTVQVEASDASGIASVNVGWSLNGSSMGNFSLEPQGGDQYEAPFPYPAEAIHVGDTVEYMVTVTDASPNANWTQSGPHEFTVLENGAKVLVLVDEVATAPEQGKFDADKQALQPCSVSTSLAAETSTLADDLRAAGFLVSEEEAAVSLPQDWDAYDLLVLCTGSNVSPVAAASLRDALRDWIARGGRLLVEGGEIGFDTVVTPGDRAFAGEVLHVRHWISDEGGALGVTAEGADHPLRTQPNVLPSTLDIDEIADYGEQDVVSPDDDAVVIYGTQADSTAAGILVYDDDTHPASAQIVYWAFAYASLSDRQTAAALAENSASYLTATQPPATSTLAGTVTVDGIGTMAGLRVWAEPSRVSALTAEDGSYVLSPLYPGNYTVWAEGPEGWETRSARVALGENERIDGVDLFLRPVTLLADSQTVAIEIPDNDPDGIHSTITMGPHGLVSTVAVGVRIEHPWQSDLVVTLTSPKGTTVTLHNRSGGDQDDLITLYPDSSRVDGPGSLDDFRDEIVEGDWVFDVSDHALGDTGRLVDWSLYLATVPSDAVGLLVSALSATPTAEGVVLSWNTSIEGATFFVRRSVDDGPWQQRNPQSLSAQDGRVRFVDAMDGIEAGSLVRYAVDALDEEGVVSSSVAELSLRIEEIPRLAFALLQNQPNPFNPSTTIVFRLPDNQKVSLRVYDIAGRRVATLVDGILGAGEHRVQWNGRDAMGRRVSSGSYFYELRTPAHRATRTMVLLK